MLKSSGKQDWGTPNWLYDKLDEIYNFQLDAAASDENHKCESYYTEVQDGLKQDWAASTFCNPPFKFIKAWTEKATEERKNGHYAVMIAPLLGFTAKWYKNIKDDCKTIVLCPRVAFVGDKSSPNGGIMLLEFGENDLGQIEWLDISSWKK